MTDYAIFMISPDGIVRSWNDGARKIKGYAPDEIIGQSIARFYTPEERSAGHYQRLLERAAADGRVEDEGWRVRKDGSRFWADVVITAVRNEDGTLRGFVKVTRDLTDRKRAEEELRHSEQRQRLMIASVSDYAIFMLDPAGRVTTWNAGAQRLKGYTPAEIIGEHFSRFYPPEEVAAGKPPRELEDAARDGRFEDEGWRVRKDGSRFWANVVISAVRDESRELLGYTKVTRDITDRRRAAMELSARTRQQAALAEMGLHALRTRDPRSVMEHAVKTAVSALGVDLVEVIEPGDAGAFVLRAGVGYPADLMGRTMDSAEAPHAAFVMDRRETLVVPGIEEDPRFAGSILRDHGARSGLTVPIHASDRGEAPYAALGAHWRTLRPASVDDVHFLQTLANVVAAAISRHKMEEQLRAAERQAQEERIRTNQAQEAIRERDEFISIAAHELRTPLAALQLKVQGLERVLRKTGGNFQDPALDSRLQGAVRQTHRLGALVERLLDISRIASGRLDLTIEEFDLSRLLEQVVEDFREPASQAGSPLRVTAPPSLRGSWDRFRIEQVLVNLLSNAVKYGGGHPIDLRVEEKDGRVELAVVDRGIGIPSSAVDRIFARFERAAPLQNYGGMGLGLYITRHIVEAHGGSVRVSTKEGEGSTFTVDLPVSRADSLAPASKSRYADV